MIKLMPSTLSLTSLVATLVATGVHHVFRLGPELIIRGARERVVPILMTVLTTGLVLVPLILAGQIPGNEIEHPMAVVIFGGLITATLLNLFVVPALYLRFGKRSEAAVPIPAVP